VNTKMAYKHRKYPEWSWSLSRDRLFKTCLRKYYYQYYKSHNGWEWDAPEEKKKTYRLKKLESLDSVLGSSVHHLLHRIIDEGLSLSRTNLDKNIKNNLNDAVLESKNKSAWEMSPTKHTMLKDIYYDGQLSLSKIDFIKYKKDKIINYLLNTDIIENIKNSFYVKSFDINTFESFDYKGTKVYAIPDLIFKKGKNKKPHIIDWKTGQEKNSNLNQLKLYVYYYYQNNEYTGETETSFIYLYEQKCKKQLFNYKIVPEVENAIEDSLKNMKKYLKDEKWNIPLREEEFTRRKNDKVCSYCKYRKICDRD